MEMTINKIRPVEYGTRADGSIWISVDGGNFHRQWDWILAKEALVLFQQTIETMLDSGKSAEARDLATDTMRICSSRKSKNKAA